jgi:hypothetical protein
MHAWRLRDASMWLMVAVLMITAGYMGAVSVVTTVKWFWFLFGMAMFLPVIYSLARTFRETVITRKDPEMIELYGKIAWLTIIMWSFYPVVWLFSEGFASFSVSFEVLSLSSAVCVDVLLSALCNVYRLQSFSGGSLSGAHCAMRTTPVATLRVVWDHRVQSLFGQKQKVWHVDKKDHVRPREQCLGKRQTVRVCRVQRTTAKLPGKQAGHRKQFR